MLLDRISMIQADMDPAYPIKKKPEDQSCINTHCMNICMAMHGMAMGNVAIDVRRARV